MKISKSKLKILIESMVKEEIELNENAAAVASNARKSWALLVEQLKINPRDPKTIAAHKTFMEAVKDGYTQGMDEVLDSTPGTY
jgi:hypothetical protein